MRGLTPFRPQPPEPMRSPAPVLNFRQKDIQGHPRLLGRKLLTIRLPRNRSQKGLCCPLRHRTCLRPRFPAKTQKPIQMNTPPIKRLLRRRYSPPAQHPPHPRSRMLNPSPTPSVSSSAKPLVSNIHSRTTTTLVNTSPLFCCFSY